MNKKCFDIFFRLPSTDSDFCCKDGEIGFAENVNIRCGDKDFPCILDNYHEAGAGSREKVVPEISFGIVRDSLNGWNIHPDMFPSKSVATPDTSMDSLTKIASQILLQFKNDAENRNLFVAPFLAMAAWKTIDGAYLFPSVPRLLIPNSEVPPVTTEESHNEDMHQMRVAGAVGKLYFQLSAQETLRDWVGVIKELVIFVSPALQKYDAFSAFVPYRNMTSSNFCRTLNPATGTITDVRVCTQTLELGWKANISGFNASALEYYEEETADFGQISFYPFVAIPLKDVDLAQSWISANDSKICRKIYGLYTPLKYTEIQCPETDTANNKSAIIFGTGREISVFTRPLKLSGAGVLKRLRRVHLRGRYNPDHISIETYASRDMIHWDLISKFKGGTVAAMPPVGFRFYKVKISGMLNEDQTLEGITLC